ncbi:MAG: thioredoxin reductase (NADPH) [Candidatus Midichloriaceae bacterium]|jgi:thioredoxin reductase (NADPH)
MSIIKTKVLIIGSGPAGYSAAIYAARAALEPVLVSGYQPGGQLTITTDVENYPGFSETIQGPWLVEEMKKQAENVGTKIISDYISEVNTESRPFKCLGDNGTEYIADTVIIATGAQAKWLGLESEKKFMGFGVSGCATCDGFFYKNKKVIVIGGGNTAVEEALYLTNHASEVLLVHRKDKLRAEKILQDRLFKNPKIKVIWNSVLNEVLGTEKPKSVNAVIIEDIQDKSKRKIDVDGVFIAIGHKPNTDLFKDKLKMDNEGYIITQPDSTETSLEGIYAAGDVQDKIYRQAVTAAGTGCMAALEAGKFLENLS